MNIVFTFPAPTGPIIATNQPGLINKLIFSKEFSVCISVHLAVTLINDIQKFSVCTVSLS